MGSNLAKKKLIPALTPCYIEIVDYYQTVTYYFPIRQSGRTTHTLHIFEVLQLTHMKMNYKLCKIKTFN